ncbi:MAG: hypothetical protein AABY40_03420 [Nanoarchaeota archaeon]
MSTILKIITKIGKIIWIILGGLILLWVGYLIYKLQTAQDFGMIILLVYLILFGLVIVGIYLLITIAVKIISFILRRIKKKQK